MSRYRCEWTAGMLAAWLVPFRADCRRHLAEIKLERPTEPASLPAHMAEMQDRYMQGMRALSKEEMEQRMLEQARGMMNVYPQAFYGNATQAAMRNASAYSVTISTAGSGGGGVEPELDGPYRPTWRQKLRAFWDAVRFG